MVSIEHMLVAAGAALAVLARASLSASWNGAIPTVGEEGVIDVRDARHPLLALQAEARWLRGRGFVGHRLPSHAEA